MKSDISFMQTFKDYKKTIDSIGKAKVIANYQYSFCLNQSKYISNMFYKLKELKGFSCVYKISLSSTKYDKTLDLFLSAKSHINYAFPQTNEVNIYTSSLYVGSSKGNVYEIMKTHLGITKEKRALSLYLNEWLSPNENITIDIIVIENKDIIKDVEISYWEIFKPMLGTRAVK